LPEFTVDARDFQKAVRGLEKRGWDATAGKNVVHAMRLILNVVRRTTRGELRPHNKTGRMRDRIRIKFVGRGMDASGSVRANGPGVNLIVGGVKPHPITAGGKVMPMWGGKGKLKTSGAGAAVEGFATRVEHPGFKGDPFFARGIGLARPEVPGILQASIDAIAAETAEHLKRGSY
jgi:hypothetical protein